MFYVPSGRRNTGGHLYCMDVIQISPYLEKLQLPSFARLVESARKNSLFMRKPAKSSTSHTPNVSNLLLNKFIKKLEY